MTGSRAYSLQGTSVEGGQTSSRFVFVAINVAPGSFSVNILRAGKLLQRVMNKFDNLARFTLKLLTGEM